MTSQKWTYDESFAIPSTALTFDRKGFDSLIRSQGVKFIHYAAQLCCVGQSDIGDNRQTHPDHSGCSGGYVFTKLGIITALFTNQGATPTLRDQGYVEGYSAVVTFATHYDRENENEPLVEFLPAPNDRFYYDENVHEIFFEKVRSNSNASDKLSLPAVKTHLPIQDNRGVFYTEGVDFKIENNKIVWTGSKTPSSTPDLKAILSVRYFYRPYWILTRKMHAIRVSHERLANGVRVVSRMSQEALLTRELLYLNSENDIQSQNPDKSRQGLEPEEP